jgi:uncharacterized protein
MNNTITEAFPIEVCREIKNYVYRLIDPRNGETFYVGRGINNRLFEHLKCALKDKTQDELDLKFQKIREINKAGLSVIHVIHRHGLNIEMAKQVEASLIDAYPGTTNISGGYGSNDFGPMNSFEIINRYKAQEVEFKNKVLMITINTSIINKSIYDATRFAWRLDVQRAKKAEYILALEKGIVVGVFLATKWYKADKDNFPEFTTVNSKRFGFVGEEANEQIQGLYMRKKIPQKYREQGASNPIKYNFD